MMTMTTYRRPMRPAMMAERLLRDFCAMPQQPVRPAFRVDVRREEDAYYIEAELPGVKLADIDITVADDVLTIAAEVNTARREEQGGYIHTERRSGRVERRFNLEGVRQEEITASSVDGILTVRLPKEQPAAGKEPRRIQVQSAAPVLEAPAEEA